MIVCLQNTLTVEIIYYLCILVTLYVLNQKKRKEDFCSILSRKSSIDSPSLTLSIVFSSSGANSKTGQIWVFLLLKIKWFILVFYALHPLVSLLIGCDKHCYVVGLALNSDQSKEYEESVFITLGLYLNL